MTTEIEKLQFQLKEANEKIKTLEDEILIYKRNQSLTKDGNPRKKPGPKKNLTNQLDKEVFIFDIFNIYTSKNKDHVVLLVGESKDHCDFGFILNKDQGKYCKYDKNDLCIIDTILDKIYIEYTPELKYKYKNSNKYTKEYLSKKDDTCIKNIALDNGINLQGVKKRSTIENRIIQYFLKCIVKKYIFKLSNENIKLIKEFNQEEKDKGGEINVKKVNVTNYNYLSNESDDFFLEIDNITFVVYKESRKHAILVSCSELIEDVPIRYGNSNYLAMNLLKYNDLRLLICNYSGYVIERSKYKKREDNIIDTSLRLYLVDKSNNKCVINDGIWFKIDPKTKSKNYIIGKKIDIFNIDHIYDISSKNLYLNNKLVNKYQLYYESDVKYGINFKIKQFSNKINIEHSILIESKHIRGMPIFLDNKCNGYLIRVKTSDSYLKIYELSYIIGTVVIYKKEEWYICQFTGMCIRKDEVIIDEDNMITNGCFLKRMSIIIYL